MNRHSFSRPIAALFTGLLIVAACTGAVGVAGPLSSPSTLDEQSPSPSATPSGSPSNSPSSGSPSASSTPANSPSPSPSAGSGTTNLTVYLFMDGKLAAVQREVPKTVAVARAAMNQLLAGPTSNDASAGRLTTEIPDDVLLLGISIANGTATVDLSREFESGAAAADIVARVAQVTYTLTQFPNVDRVALRLDGQPALDRPATRDDYRDYSPSILVDRPGWGGTLANPARITGESNVFEAQFRVQIQTASGKVLADQQVHAACGTGCWGAFDITVPYRVGADQPGRLKVYNLSAKDGSVEDVRIYQVQLTAG
jgi:germination protein M